jgi:putative addiction module killer protein
VEQTVLQTGTFKAWLTELRDETAKDAIVARIVRIQSGLMGDFKSIGGKVIEFRIDVSKGYRIYATKRGKTIILLLVGGTKKTQSVGAAQAMVVALEKARKSMAGRTAK